MLMLRQPRGSLLFVHWKWRDTFCWFRSELLLWLTGDFSFMLTFISFRFLAVLVQLLKFYFLSRLTFSCTRYRVRSNAPLPRSILSLQLFIWIYFLYFVLLSYIWLYIIVSIRSDKDATKSDGVASCSM